MSCVMFLNDINVLHIIIWVAIFIVAVIIEFATQELVSIWFGLGAVPSLILAAFGIDFWWQAGSFAIVSAIAFVLSQVFIRKRIKFNRQATNADSLIGKEILIIKDVSPHSLGEGRIRDVVWSVASKDEIQAETYAIVEQITGNKLIVRKKEEGK